MNKYELQNTLKQVQISGRHRDVATEFNISESTFSLIVSIHVFYYAK